MNDYMKEVNPKELKDNLIFWATHQCIGELDCPNCPLYDVCEELLELVYIINREEE